MPQNLEKSGSQTFCEVIKLSNSKSYKAMEIDNQFIDALSFDTEDLSQEQLQTQFNEFKNQVIEQVDAFENYSVIFRLLSDYHISLTSILELQKALNNKKKWPQNFLYKEVDSVYRTGATTHKSTHNNSRTIC
jgi:hypothetical protein